MARLLLIYFHLCIWSTHTPIEHAWIGQCILCRPPMWVLSSPLYCLNLLLDQVEETRGATSCTGIWREWEFEKLLCPLQKVSKAKKVWHLHGLNGSRALIWKDGIKTISSLSLEGSTLSQLFYCHSLEWRFSNISTQVLSYHTISVHS